MLVKCIDNIGIVTLSLGSLYTVIDQTELYYTVENNNGVVHSYIKEIFAIIEEFSKLQVGKKYNWKSQPKRLVYLGYNFSGNGYWHQFAKVETPEDVWCECLDHDLKGIEESEQLN